MNPSLGQSVNPPLESGGGGINISFPEPDWATLIPQLFGYFFDALGKTVDDTMHKAFDGVWGSSANVVGQTSLAYTWDFGPVHDQVLQVEGAARAILLFGLVVLGLKSMLGGIVPRHHDVISEAVDGALAAVIMVSAFPALVPELIRLTNTAATAVGTADLSRYMRTDFGGQSPMVLAVLFVVAVFFGLRLIYRGAWRIVLLGVLLPVGMFAAAAYAVPSLRWLFVWWARSWGGLLLAQIPSVLALTIGLQLAAYSGGITAFMLSIAAMAVATDVYTIIPNAVSGGSHGSAPWGGLPVLPMLSRAAGPAAVAAGAATTTQMSDAQIKSFYGY